MAYYLLSQQLMYVFCTPRCWDNFVLSSLSEVLGGRGRRVQKLPMYWAHYLNFLCDFYGKLRYRKCLIW